MHLKQVKVADSCVGGDHNSKSTFFKARKPSDEPGDKLSTNILVAQIKDFTERTSCHGVNRISDTQSLHNWFRWKNIMWVLLTLASFSIACSGLVNIIQDYYSYPTSTSISIDYVPQAEFPAVTFCNLNLVMPSRLPDYSVYENYWTRLSKTDAKYLEDQPRLDQLIAHFGSLSKQEKEAYGHNIEEMVVDCEYGGEPCSVDDFFWTYNQNYGNCYSFNFGIDSNGTEQAIRKVRRAGKGGGLSLSLDVQSDMYLDMTSEMGIIVMVHKAGVFPYMEEMGRVASPGHVTSWGLIQEEKALLEPPYGVCVRADSDGNKDMNMFASSGFVYTTKVCQRSCAQAYVIQVCGCCDRNVPCNPDGLTEAFGIPFPKEGNLSVCNGSDWEVTRCVGSALAQSVVVCANQCYPECKSLSYTIQQSIGLWPNKRRVDAIFQKINGSSRLADMDNDVDASQNISIEQQYSFIRETVVKLDIHYVTMSKTVISYEPTYTWNLLLSNVGGQLGLWLGFSVLTAFEFVHLFFDVVVLGIKMAFQQFRWCHCLKIT